MSVLNLPKVLNQKIRLAFAMINDSLANYQAKSEKDEPNGYIGANANGLIDPEQIDGEIGVSETLSRHNSFNAFPETGDITKIYLTENENKLYKWKDNNNTYEELSPLDLLALNDALRFKLNSNAFYHYFNDFDFKTTDNEPFKVWKDDESGIVENDYLESNISSSALERLWKCIKLAGGIDNVLTFYLEGTKKTLDYTDKEIVLESLLYFKTAEHSFKFGFSSFIESFSDNTFPVNSNAILVTFDPDVDETLQLKIIEDGAVNENSQSLGYSMSPDAIYQIRFRLFLEEINSKLLSKVALSINNNSENIYTLPLGFLNTNFVDHGGNHPLENMIYQASIPSGNELGNQIMGIDYHSHSIKYNSR